MYASIENNSYRRLITREVKIGDVLLGNRHPIRIQTMTTTDTMNTDATVAQTIRCIEAGAELVRITAPSKKEAENLAAIKEALRKQGYNTPLVADIHFTPNAAEIAARIVEKVRINPGNYVDKKKFELIEYTDKDYAEEIDRIRDRFTPLLKICKEWGTAMRIGTNHGSLSDRIMSRYGDTPVGMVESAMEFLRMARAESYHNIVLSMKSSNPQVMVQAYRLLVQTMQTEFGECYPLHLGVTEAGDGEDGRIKSAIGIGTLLEEGLGDTVRVSLTEDPEAELPVCKDLVKRYGPFSTPSIDVQNEHEIKSKQKFIFTDTVSRRETFVVNNIGGHNVPAVIADLSKLQTIQPGDLKNIGYTYDQSTDKWNIGDAAADFIYTGSKTVSFALPGTLNVIVEAATWVFEKVSTSKDKQIFADNCFPIYNVADYLNTNTKSEVLNFVTLDCDSEQHFEHEVLKKLGKDKKVVICLSSKKKNALASVRSMFEKLVAEKIKNPVVLIVNSHWNTADEHLIHYATEAGALLLDGLGDGIFLSMTRESYALSSNNDQRTTVNASGRNYLQSHSVEQFLNNTAFSILQATRTRISKTEYISCPSCGRTLFDLQETTAKIRAVTHHLKGVKIAIMGCIVNGPGEMADADFGYVGSGPGKITLYKGKEIVKRNVPSETAVEELIALLKAHSAWVERPQLAPVN